LIALEIEPFESSQGTEGTLSSILSDLGRAAIEVEFDAFSLKIRRLVATMLIMFVIIN